MGFILRYYPFIVYEGGWISNIYGTITIGWIVMGEGYMVERSSLMGLVISNSLTEDEGEDWDVGKSNLINLEVLRIIYK